jgi:hypothetical protein
MTSDKTLRAWKPTRPNKPISMITTVTPEVYDSCDLNEVVWRIRLVEYQLWDIMKAATKANEGELK